MLTPFEVDQWTGYRYYDIKQLRQLTRIAYLKRLGFIIEEIVCQLEQVFKKSLPERVFATHRRKIDSYQELFNLCPNVIGPEMERLGCPCPEPPYCFTVEYNEEHGVDIDIDIEYFEAVAKTGEDSDLVKFKSLPEVPVALCIKHYGAYENMPETFAEIYGYAEANAYEISDRPRFCYIGSIKVWGPSRSDPMFFLPYVEGIIKGREVWGSSRFGVHQGLYSSRSDPMKRELPLYNKV